MQDQLLAEQQRDVLARVAALESEASRLHAESIQARYALRLLWEQAAGPDEFGIIELAGTARIGQTRACTQLVDAGRLVELFPGVLASLAAGRMSVHMSDLLLQLTRSCDEHVQQVVADRLLPELERLNTTDARRRIAETILAVEAELDPDAAAEREKRARARRDVYVRPVEDGMCQITALLDNLTTRRWALDFDELVRAQTCADKAGGITRTAGQRRADVFAALPSQLLHLLQMIATGDISTLVDLARRDPQAAEGLADLAEQTSDLLDVPASAPAPEDDTAAPVPPTAGTGEGTATDMTGLSAQALTQALLRLKIRNPRVLNVHVPMETLLDLDQRAGWVEDVGPISPYRARCLLPLAALRRVVTGQQTGLPLKIDPDLQPEPDVPLDAATARQRLLRMLAGLVLLDEAHAAHDPTREIHDLIALRDVTCTGIGCARPARLCDDDHEKPHPEGPTAEWNLSNKSRRCHIAKHHGWTVTRSDDTGDSTWTSPLGHTYTRPPAWQPPTPLPEDLELPEPRIVTDDEPDQDRYDVCGRALTDLPLAQEVPTPALPDPQNTSEALGDIDPDAPF